MSYSDSNKDGFIQLRQYFWQECETPQSPWDLPNCLDGWRPGEIVEVNNYYPFGLLHNYTATTQNAYQHKYNGKELQETGMYDYGARFYMPDLGRWGVVDPLAETSRRWSTYNYAYNNPIRFIDPDGRETTDWIRKNGVWEYDKYVTTAEQAQKISGVDGFAKNGTIFSNVSVDGGTESAYAQLNEGGSITKLSSDEVNITSIPNMLSFTTWSAEEFPQITNSGNQMTRTDFDASTHDKKFGNDKTFTLDWGSSVVPSTFPADGSKGGPTWAGRVYAGTWVLDRIADLKSTLSGGDSKNDSALSVYNTWTLDKNGSFKTLDTAKYIKNNDSTGFMRFMNSVDEQRKLKIKNLGQ
ncbi:hypothetical protein IW16_16650 [Chryseobacterium vrystaatense]|uniref:RHS repeat-associated core domain-containing protein n=1 Tax=Chryseobacterium vrystaatense TaxID=307480 RepID=A0ABR4UJY9_9FLAO|nr:RHS repeat-associated core domain-containing protein [Chryseobacterium vrystaatense]KFF25054.1 hypothetical protein IW16_16650 [Chryseobacterium vrystaatense]